jgi:predicted RNA-binding Zn-ribbon protein involved in translation (DUF1610 family)
MIGLEPCQSCGVELEQKSEDTARVVGGKAETADVVRFLCPSCNRGGSIYYRDGQVIDRLGPAVTTDASVRVDDRREPSPGVDHGAVATDGGALDDV